MKCYDSFQFNFYYMGNISLHAVYCPFSWFGIASYSLNSYICFQNLIIMNFAGELNTNKAAIIEFGYDRSYSGAVKCNNLIIVLCMSGEANIEINYVNYTIRKNALLSIHPYDIVALKEGSSDFKCKALLLPMEMFTPLIAELNMSHYDYVKKNPLIYLGENYLKLIEATFEFVERASQVLDIDRFEQVVLKQVSSLFYVQQQYFSTYGGYNAKRHEYVSRKKELFRRFIQAILESHSVSREVLFYANELGISSGYLNELCNDISHHTAKEIIDSAVTAKLKYELSYSSKSIQELADEYNFPSQSYFSRYYKRMTGMTPSEFRKRS